MKNFKFMKNNNIVGFLIFIFCTTPMIAADSSKISTWDRFWAKYDGIDPEVYIMMKELDLFMKEMQNTASIAKKESKENDLEGWIKEKINDRAVEIATEYNPAAKPIKKMFDIAMSGTNSWLDWSFRRRVDEIYTKYKADLTKYDDIKKALGSVESWLKDCINSSVNRMEYQQLRTIYDNRELLFAYIVATHERFNPELYDTYGFPDEETTTGDDESNYEDETENNKPPEDASSANRSGSLSVASLTEHYESISKYGLWNFTFDLVTTINSDGGVTARAGNLKIVNPEAWASSDLSTEVVNISRNSSLLVVEVKVTFSGYDNKWSAPADRENDKSSWKWGPRDKNLTTKQWRKYFNYTFKEFPDLALIKEFKVISN